MKRGKKSKKKIAVPKKKVSKTKKIVKKKVSKKKTLTNKQWLAISIITFLVFAIALAFTNVPQNASITGAIVPGLEFGNTSVNIGTFLTEFLNPSQIDTTLLKYAFFLLLTIFIFSILSLADFPHKPVLRFLLALPVSYLSIILIKPEEILSASVLYSSLGMTFIVMIPLIIMVLFTTQVLQGKLTVGKMVIQLMAWYFYLAFLIYFLVRAFTDIENVYSLGVIIVIIVGMVISLGIIIFNKKIRLWLRDRGREAREEILKDVEDIKKARETAETLKAARTLEDSKAVYKAENG